MRIKYLWSKFIKKLPSSAVSESVFEYPSRVEARSTVLKTKMGRYSYCGYGCTLINCNIGRFCSIADNVKIGLPNHPMTWVSTSCAFYFGRDSIPKDLAQLEYDSFPQKTIIGNDVWIGTGAIVKQGLTIGDGAVIGMGAIVTKDVPAYAVVAGAPAKVLKYRFSQETRDEMIKIKWWNMEPSELKEKSSLFDNPEAFIEMIRGKGLI